MSVDMTHYFGIGIKLTDKEIDDFDKYNDFEDKYPQYSRYEFMRRNTEAKSNIRLIVDGMCGLYAYLMYVIKDADYEDMWSSERTAEFPLNSIESANAISELQEVYSLLENGKELRVQEVKVISLFHFS